MAPSQVRVTGIGILGPGLAGWPQAREALRDPSRWQPAPTLLPPPARLPPAERRRSGAAVRLALALADEACAMAGADAAAIATVFASSAGDGANCHALCEALATTERAVSPTRFTNSVHNAPAGYWHIATRSRAPSTSLSAHDASFGAGLLEAMGQCLAHARAVLLVCGDVPYPEPLASARPLPDAFGIALVLEPAAPGASLARLRLHAAGQPVDGAAFEADEAAWTELRRATPAGRGLPLLRAIARGHAAAVPVADGRSGLPTVEVEPAAS